MSSLAVITARGGSKRIPRKNIRPFMGRPMVCYAIDAANGSRLFDEVMVSTDDEEIAQVARKAGALVPFMRSRAAADDHATTRDALLDVIRAYAGRGRAFDAFACIYPCVPFLTAEILREAHAAFAESGADALMPVVKFSFPVQRAQTIDADGFLSYREPENAPRRSQDLEPTFHDAGMFYFHRTSRFLSDEPERTIPFVLPEDCVQDIDTMDDWRLAEMKYRLLRGQDAHA